MSSNFASSRCPHLEVFYGAGPGSLSLVFRLGLRREPRLCPAAGHNGVFRMDPSSLVSGMDLDKDKKPEIRETRGWAAQVGNWWYMHIRPRTRHSTALAVKEKIYCLSSVRFP